MEGDHVREEYAPQTSNSCGVFLNNPAEKKSDCAHFIAHCLAAGGIRIANVDPAAAFCPEGLTVRNTDLVASLHALAKQHENIQEIGISDAIIGDIGFLSNVLRPSHAFMICQPVDLADPLKPAKAYAHTANRACEDMRAEIRQWFATMFRLTDGCARPAEEDDMRTPSNTVSPDRVGLLDCARGPAALGSSLVLAFLAAAGPGCHGTLQYEMRYPQRNAGDRECPSALPHVYAPGHAPELGGFKKKIIVTKGNLGGCLDVEENLKFWEDSKTCMPTTEEKAPNVERHLTFSVGLNAVEAKLDENGCGVFDAVKAEEKLVRFLRRLERRRCIKDANAERLHAEYVAAYGQSEYVPSGCEKTTSCGADLTTWPKLSVTCVAFPGRSMLIPEIQVQIQDAWTYIAVGTTLRNIVTVCSALQP